MDDKVKGISDLVKVPVPPVKDLSAMTDEDVFQLNLYVVIATEQKIMREALVSCESSRWHPAFADVNVKGTNKTVGIDAFLKYYQIDLSETMAFGDGGTILKC